MSDKALFSVVVLMYNNAEYLEECLKSVFSQSYSSIELIVVDDYSKTFEKEKIIDFIECNKHDNIQSFVVYQNPKNYGTVKSINVALTHCSGEYIKLLAADDSFNDANALDVVANTFIETDCLFVASKVVICDKFMKPIHRGEKKKQININQWDSEKCFKELCKTNIYDTIGIFYSKAFFEVTGSFDESYVLLEDWPKFLMAAKMGFKPYYIDIETCKYRSDVGNGTGVNPIYLRDKKTVMNQIVKKSIKQIGLWGYLVSLLRFTLTTSVLVRRIYGILFR